MNFILLKLIIKLGAISISLFKMASSSSSSSSSASASASTREVNVESPTGTPITTLVESPNGNLVWTNTLENSDDEGFIPAHNSKSSRNGANRSTKTTRDEPAPRVTFATHAPKAVRDGPALGTNVRPPANAFPPLSPPRTNAQQLYDFITALQRAEVFPEAAIPGMAQLALDASIAAAKNTNRNPVPPAVTWTTMPIEYPRPGQAQSRSAQPPVRSAQPRVRAAQPRAAQNDFQSAPAKTPKTHAISDVLAAFAYHEGRDDAKIAESPGINKFLRVTDRDNFILPRWKSVTRNGQPWNQGLFQTKFLSPMLNPPFMIELNSDGSFHQWVLTVEDRSHVVPCDLATVIDTHNANILG